MARTKQTTIATTTAVARATAAKMAGAKTPASSVKKPAAIKHVAAPTAAVPAIAKAKRRVRPGTKAEREIRRLQKGTETLIPKTRIRALIREVIEARRDKHRANGNDDPLKVQGAALDALQVAAEDVLIKLLAKTRTFMRHAKRVTIMRSDIKLAAKEMGLTQRTIVD